MYLWTTSWWYMLKEIEDIPITEWDEASKDLMKLFCFDPTEVSLK